MRTGFNRTFHVLARTIFVLAALSLSSFAQHIGDVQITTQYQTVFTAKAANAVSGTLINLGVGAHFLTYCNTGFAGKISLEASADGTFAAPITLASAYYGQNSTTDTGCHVLQAGGFYPTVQARISNYVSGSVTAFYSSASAPITYTPIALGSNGPTSPVACDRTAILQFSPSATGAAIGVLAGANIYVCGAVISFGGTTTAAAITFSEYTDATCTTSVSPLWEFSVQASQGLTFMGGALGALFHTTAVGHALCMTVGATTASTNFTLSYAQF